ncbi:MAG TPA: hypothetical protein VIM16_19950 [Mucilaginibacter sp.]|jgi:uncharacterized membrane protein
MELTKNFGIKDTGKAAGIISYFTIIGWLFAYFALHQNNKTAFGSYQLRQTLLLHIVFLAVRISIPFILGAFWVGSGILSMWYFLRLIEFIFFILWILGLIGAINSETKPIPLIGERAQTMFSNL